ncbi:MAG: hypothetical protein JNL21_16825 [Myxococcales bacterium]|nr:hypothetical protein [Myxococcales bacterium]
MTDRPASAALLVFVGLGCGSPTEATGRTATASPASSSPPAVSATGVAAPLPSAKVPATSTTAPSVASPAPSAPGAPSLVRDTCPKEDPSFTPTGQYSHKRTRLFVHSQGSPRHAASDVVVRAGAAPTIEGKFTYGKGGKDLEDEEISLFIRDRSCAWLSVGTGFTNDDGWVSISVPETLTVSPGVYAFQLVVRGDGSRAEGNLFAVSPKTPAVVFDVDATLTTSDQELFDELVEGKVPEARPNGRDVANELADSHLLVVYLTGRPYFLGPTTRRWLESNGFPGGFVRTTKRLEEARPTPGGVGTYKEAALTELASAGLDLKLAYGNAPTDVCAYAKAGIDPKKTFILGPHGGEACDGHAPSQALSGYDAHVGRTGDILR